MVIVIKDTDANKKTRKMPLNDHLYAATYRIQEIKGDCVDLVNNQNKIEKNVHKSRIRFTYKKFASFKPFWVLS